MKVAILAAEQPGFVMPMANGLQKMLNAIGITTEVFPQGLLMLNYSNSQPLKTLVKNTLKKMVNRVRPQRFLLQQGVTGDQVSQFEKHLQSFDAIVVVCHIPDAFRADRLNRLEHIRQLNPTNSLKRPAIVLYQNYYLATRGHWYERIKADGGFGLERYDWYFAASVTSDYPLSDDSHPVSLIGHNLGTDDLFVNDNKTEQPFKVLLDFTRKGFEKYRELQIEALEKTATPYYQLTGRYSLSEIRALYREHCALFLSFRESFGLPIVENQLCGNYIFAPYKSWTPSHYLAKPLSQAGEGELGSNFRIYDHHLETLVKQIEHCRQNYQPQQLVANFTAQYPHLYQGDTQALHIFFAQLTSGDINAESHRQHVQLNQHIVGAIIQQKA
ncbi:MAG: hypothetical protein ACI9FJ_000302 [Alteromonadaceae bacterium]|jgi:hypothetical protein